MDLFTNVSSPIPFPDAIQEFSVQMGSVPAPLRVFMPGAVINMGDKIRRQPDSWRFVSSSCENRRY